jgi:inner membrane protein
MDNLTHSLTGLALARTGLQKYTPHGTLLLIVAANLPDADGVSWFWGPLKYLEIHRGYAHSLIGLPLVALAAVLITAAIRRKRLPWLGAWAIACVGVASHLLLDWSMSYGIRLLLPFSSTWYRLDFFGLVDWIVLAVLLLAWLGPWLGKLVSNEIGSRPGKGRGLAIFALVFFAAYGGFRALMHARVMEQLQSRVYVDLLGSPANRIAAFPETANPFAWNAVVEGDHAYRMYRLYALGNFDPDGGMLLYKTNWTPALERVSQTKTFRYCSYFTLFPYWQEYPAADDSKTVTLSDLRFGAPSKGFFGVTAILNPAGQVERITFGSIRSKNENQAF